MSFEEKSAWIMGVLAVAAYTTYLVIVLGLAQAAPLTEVDYVPALLWTIGASIVAAIVIHIIVAMISPRDADKKDQRDRQIYRFGEYVGQSFVVIGAVAAMLMAMFRFDYFWIANLIYLCFALSAILGTITKIVSYRRGLPAW